jgi:anti-anti-sigma regulatory factor
VEKLILNLTGVEEIDSTGANIVINCFLAAQRAGAELRLAGARPRVARLFTITRLNTVLSVYPRLRQPASPVVNMLGSPRGSDERQREPPNDYARLGAKMD